MTTVTEFSELPDSTTIRDKNSAMSALAQVIASANHQVTLAMPLPADEPQAEQVEESPPAEPAYELPELGQANVRYAASLHAAFFMGRPQSELSDRLKEWLPKLHDVMTKIAAEFEGASWSVTVGAPLTVSVTINFPAPRRHLRLARPGARTRTAS